MLTGCYFFSFFFRVDPSIFRVFLVNNAFVTPADYVHALTQTLQSVNYGSVNSWIMIVSSSLHHRSALSSTNYHMNQFSFTQTHVHMIIFLFYRSKLKAGEKMNVKYNLNGEIFKFYRKQLSIHDNPIHRVRNSSLHLANNQPANTCSPSPTTRDMFTLVNDISCPRSAQYRQPTTHVGPDNHKAPFLVLKDLVFTDSFWLWHEGI